MVSKAYQLEYDGYWREPNVGGMSDNSGIYCVYSCVFNASEKTVTLKKVLYIGESENIRERISSHEKWDAWKSKLTSGQQLCLSAALINGDADRRRAEAAMINKHKPPCNTEYVNAFPYDQTSIATSGKNGLLDPNFTVYRS